MASKTKSKGKARLIDKTSFELYIPQTDTRSTLPEGSTDVSPLPSHTSGTHGDGGDQSVFKPDGVVVSFVPVKPATNGKEYQRKVRSQAMKNYHAVRRRAAAEANAAWYVKQFGSNKAVPPPYVLSGTPLDTWTHDPFIKCPFDLTHSDRELLHYIHTDSRPQVVRYREQDLESEWVYSARYPGAFHMYMALLSIGMRNKEDTPEEAKKFYHKQELKHNALALQQVRTMMTSSGRLIDDGLIITKLPELIQHGVVNLLFSAQINHDRTATQIHLNALETIINMRGGIDALPIELQFVVFWTDAKIAFVWDQLPRFKPPVVCTVLIPQVEQPLVPLLPGCQKISDLLDKHYSTSPEYASWRKEFDTVSRFSSSINARSSVSSAFDFKFLNLYTIQCHKLLTARHSNSPTIVSDIVLSTLHITLSLFLITATPMTKTAFFLKKNSQQRRTKGYLDMLRDVLEKGGEWGEWEDLRVWATAMGFVESRDEEETGEVDAVLRENVHWWTERWKEELKGLEERGEWEQGQKEVPKVVKEIMWVDSQHGARYKHLLGRLGLE